MATDNRKNNNGIKNLKPFKPGQSGNPGGRPKMDPDIKAAFEALTPVAIAKLQEIILADGTKDADRLRAIDIALDRGLGKPVQGVDLKTDMPQVVFIGGDNVPD